MDPRLPSLFGPDAGDSPPALAAAMAPPAAPGHYDELRGAVSAPPNAPPTPAWARFFDHLGAAGFADLHRRTLNLQRQIRDNGVSYNVYADAGGPQRPWSLDLFPLLVTPPSWREIEAGVLQRVRLLDRIMADVYGPRQLLAENLLPPALVHGHPGYLRPLHGVTPAGGTHLHIAAFDLARGPGGDWSVVSQRTQAPSGLGYLLENRLIISRLFPEAFSDLRVQRLAASYRALADALRSMSPAAGEPRIVLLTPGPCNETYFEHAYLARYLGLTLVEGGDLSVREQRLYLKTLHGLEPVHGILKRLDDEFLDPLELRADSRLGVPGLLQAIRAGNVLVANAPGSGFLESTALLGFLPALSRRLLGDDLHLPSLATAWRGEGEATQAMLPLSQMPTWKRERLAPRSLMLRVFAVCDGPQSWRVLPGGLTRLAGGAVDIASMQRGGSSADTWVLTDGPVDATTLLRHEQPAAAGPHHHRSTTSRAGENLFWLGRYTERTENTTRVVRLALECLNGDEQSSPPLLAWLGELAAGHALVAPGAPAAARSRRGFERALIAALADTEAASSVGYNLAALRAAASAVRERLSREQWNVIVRAENEFLRGCALCTEDGDFSPVEALRVLDTLSGHTAAMTGAQSDRMTRDDGWRLLSSGRLLERLGFLASALAGGFETGAVSDRGGFDALVALFDSTITFHAQYQQRRDLPALLELLVLDRDNPRSLGWVAQALRGRLASLARRTPSAMPAITLALPDPRAWSLEALCQRDETGRHAHLLALLQQCEDAPPRLSEELGARYFSHSGGARLSVGA